MNVSFRCKQSGNVVSFTDEQDIDWMRKESHYEEVKDEKEIKQTIGESTVGNSHEGDNEKDAGKGHEIPKDGNDGQKDKVLKKRGRKPRSAQ